ncbi:putative Tyrosine kinase-like (TKL) protein [Neospora caninum Liverpool]|uniref:Putative Tyrosine kinase-like (TKL) protein n=1 Tax=Neospora caninum (strain Liverpool) TaxID=572307 RepID=F0VLZ6_NEOCL|nr:putative Tyrosine kinase-like (TKL) protein [Neospora caninum Liverpool]CBZ54274.1 putative Tyrosine kinase-like (TKL) protein [Neospora caninum Liverpool]|eukprot:XP_003884305.1 putative Tyrosine kinase-like (TKL) protein [Neospora caninum Liverpool]
MEAGPRGVKQRGGGVGAVEARRRGSPVNGDRLDGDGEDANEKSTDDDALNDISLEYSYEELYGATAGFSVILGQGAYGNVYEGVLRDGVAVAVKWLHKPKEAGFEKEVKVLSKFRHPHLVILLGFARHGRDRFLVYELLSGGDVGMRLQKGPLLAWQDRLSLALDSASALSHLQHHSPQVYHRDIKTANILLDKHNSAKVADFGLACLAKKGENSCAVKQTAGTIGYADPKYISSAVVTEMTEVYSFGMVLLELLTARPPAVLNPDGSITYLLSTIGTSIRRTLRYIDPRARFPPHVAQSLAILAFSCIQEDERHRPSFRSIVQQLQLLCTAANLHPCPSLTLGRAVAAAAAAAAAASGSGAKVVKAHSPSPSSLRGLPGVAAQSRCEASKVLKKTIRVTGRRESPGDSKERERDEQPETGRDDAPGSPRLRHVHTDHYSHSRCAASAELDFLASPSRDGREDRLETRRLTKKTSADEANHEFPSEREGTKITTLEAVAVRNNSDVAGRRDESRARVVPGWRRESQEVESFLGSEAKRAVDDVLGRAREKVTEQMLIGPLTTPKGPREGNERAPEYRAPESVQDSHPDSPSSTRIQRAVAKSPSFAPDRRSAPDQIEQDTNWRQRCSGSRNPGAVDKGEVTWGAPGSRRLVSTIKASSSSIASHAAETVRPVDAPFHSGQVTRLRSARADDMPDEKPAVSPSDLVDSSRLPSFLSILCSSAAASLAAPTGSSSGDGGGHPACGRAAAAASPAAARAVDSPSQLPQLTPFRRPESSRVGTVSSAPPLVATGVVGAGEYEREGSAPPGNFPHRQSFPAESMTGERVGEGASRDRLRTGGIAPLARFDTCGARVGTREQFLHSRHSDAPTRTLPDGTRNSPSAASEGRREPDDANLSVSKVSLASFETEKGSSRGHAVQASNVPGAFCGEPPPGGPPQEASAGKAVCGPSADAHAEVEVIAGSFRAMVDGEKQSSSKVKKQGAEEDKQHIPDVCRARSVAFCTHAEREGDADASPPCSCARSWNTRDSCCEEAVPVMARADTPVSWVHQQVVGSASRTSRYEGDKGSCRERLCQERPGVQGEETGATHSPQGLPSPAVLLGGDGESSVSTSPRLFHQGKQRVTGDAPPTPHFPSSGKELAGAFPVVHEGGDAQGSAQCSFQLSHGSTSAQSFSSDERVILVTSPLPPAACVLRQNESRRPATASHLTEGTGGSTRSTAAATPLLDAGSACSSARGELEPFTSGRMGPVRVIPDTWLQPSQEKGEAVAALHSDTLWCSERPQSGLLESVTPPASVASGEPSVEILKRHSDFLGDASAGRPSTTVGLAADDLSQAAAGVPADASTSRSRSGVSPSSQLPFRGSAGGVSPCLLGNKNGGAGPKTIRLPHTVKGGTPSLSPLELEGSNDGDLSPKKLPSHESISGVGGLEQTNEDGETSDAGKDAKLDFPSTEDEESIAAQSLPPASCDESLHREDALADAPHILSRQALAVSWRSFAGWSDWGRLWSCPTSTHATSTEDTSEMHANEEKAHQTFGDPPASVSKGPDDDWASTGCADSGREESTREEAESLSICKTEDEFGVTHGEASATPWEGNSDRGTPSPRGAAGETDDREQAEETTEALPSLQKSTDHDVPVMQRRPEGFREFIVSLFSGRQQPAVPSALPTELDHPDAFSQEQPKSCIEDPNPVPTEGGVGAAFREQTQDPSDEPAQARSSSVLEREAKETGAPEDVERDGCGKSKKSLSGSGFLSRNVVRALSGPKTLRQIQGREASPFQPAALDDQPGAHEMRAEKARRFLAGGGD